MQEYLKNMLSWVYISYQDNNGVYKCINSYKKNDETYIIQSKEQYDFKIQE